MTARKDGQPVIRFSHTERDRVIRTVTDLHGQGYSVADIGRALGLKVDTIRKQLHRAGMAPSKTQTLHGLPALSRIEWRDREVPVDLTVDYHLSLPVRSVRENLRYLQETNGVVRFAYDVNEALEAGDQTWVTLRRNDISALMEYLRRMVAVVDDPEARARARTDHNERDDLRPTLRRVAG